jgi:hypothetical protein
MDSIVFTIMEPTLPLRLQDVYGFTSLKVGLIYLSASVPSIICELYTSWALCSSDWLQPRYFLGR